MDVLEDRVARNLRRRHGVRLEHHPRDAEPPDVVALAAALALMDEGPLEVLPDVAADAIAQGGPATPARLALADLDSSAAQRAELDEALGGLLAELGVPRSYAGAITLFCRLHVDRIARDAVHPYIGAACLEWAGGHSTTACAELLSTFTALAQRWRGRPEQRDTVENEIRAEARRRRSDGALLPPV